MGLVIEKLEEKRAPMVPRNPDPRRMADVLKELVTKPPTRTYSLSSFGFRFLEFIAKKDVPAPDTGDHPRQPMPHSESQ
jgi:hypothetical protein